MKHKLISFLIAALLLLSLSLPTFAAETATISNSKENIIHYSDGSYLVITINPSKALTKSTRSGDKSYAHYSNHGVLEWMATLTASFTYNGSTSTCTFSSLSVSISDTSWYQVSGSAYHSGNTATADFTMADRILGITYTTQNYSITLSCDKDGNLS